MRNNVTEVYFNGQEMTTILVHWQHDYKQILKFADLDLPFAYEVDFANAGDTTSITMIGNADGVEIPDEYLMTGKAINAYIYLHDVSDSGETVRKVSIQVHGRPERTEEIPDPHQQSVIDQAIAALDAAVEQTASDVQTTGEYKEEAHGYADEAKGYAERAESAESEVEGYATRAETAAGQAEGYATTASEKASEASGYVTEAKGYSESASGYASEAKGYSESASRFASDAQASSDASYLSAQSSSRYASDASGYAGAAYESAQSASGSASDASSAKDLAVQAKDDAISAKNDAVSAKNDAVQAKNDAVSAKNSAEGFASDASGSADLAEGYANDAQTSAEQAQESAEYVEGALNDKADIITSFASGEIVTISDGGNDLPVVDLKLSLLPVQDLHGQSAPYPPGGGKNKIDISNPYASSPYVSVQNGVIVGSGGYTNSGIVYEVSGLTVGSPYYASVVVKTNSTGYRIAIYVLEGGTGENYTSSTGTIGFSFNPTNETVRIKIEQRANGNWSADQLQLESGSSKTDFAPYSNICPISGWTGVDIYNSGHNLLDNNGETIEGKYINNSGNFVNSDPDLPTRIYTQQIPIRANTQYVVSAKSSAKAYIRVGRYRPNGTFISRGLSSNVVNPSITLASRDEPSYILVSPDSICTDLQVEFGTVKTDYVPYTGSESASIDWSSSAGTVYGGSLDLTTGVLTVDRAIVAFDGTETWGARSIGESGQRFTRSISGSASDSSSTVCSHAKFKNSNAGVFGEFRIASDTFIMLDGGLHFADATAFQTWVASQYSANTPLTAVYPLVTPTTYQLTPTQIETLLGTNNIWSNGNGVVDLEYRCDTKLYIEQLTKPSEDDMTANQNITSGSFFMVGNRLFLSTVAIAQGATIIPGTNCTEVSLADALNSLNS